MHSRKKISRKIVKKSDTEDVLDQPGEISREEAIDLLMLGNEERPTSPRYPKKSLESEDRIPIPNVDVEVPDKPSSPSSPVIPPNRKKRPVIRRVPANSVGNITKEDDVIPIGIQPKRNITPEVLSTKERSPSLPIGLKPSPKTVSVNTPDRQGTHISLIKPNNVSPASHVNTPVRMEPASPASFTVNQTPIKTPARMEPASPLASPVNTGNSIKTPARMGPASPLATPANSIKTPARMGPATPVNNGNSIKTPARMGPATPVNNGNSIKTPARMGPATPVNNGNTGITGNSIKTPARMEPASPLDSPSASQVNQIPIINKTPANTKSNISNNSITPGLLPRNKFSTGPKVVISTIPDDEPDEEDYSYTPGVAVPIRPPEPTGSSTTSTRRREPEPAYIPLTKNKDGIPDYSSLDPVQQAAKWSEFEVKFNIIREHNPTYLITLPDRNNETLEEVHVRHREYVKHIAKTEFVDDCVEEYRAYLIIMWALIELLCSKLLLINSAGGYFVFQLSRFKKYEGLLVQLGEEGWSESKGKSSSPLWSLILSSVVTAVIFILVNFLLGSFPQGVSREVSDKAISFLLGERIDEEEGGISDFIRQITGGTGDLSSVIDTVRGMAGFFGGNFAQATQ